MKEFFDEFLHEIKTPLAIMRSHLESEIGNERIPLEVRQKLVLDIEEIARVNHLVNEMKVIIQSQRALPQLELEEVSFLALLIDVVELLSPIAQENNQNIELNAHENITLVMDAKRIKQLCYNLINNAMKYSSTGARIEVSLYSSTEGIELHIKDNGIGISKENQAKIFDQFFRVSSKKEGSGLGLSVVSAIVSMHKAQMSLESTLGKGSEFCILFPQS